MSNEIKKSLLDAAVERYFELFDKDATLDTKQKLAVLNQIKGKLLQGVSEEVEATNRKLEFLKSLLND